MHATPGLQDVLVMGCLRTSTGSPNYSMSVLNACSQVVSTVKPALIMVMGENNCIICRVADRGDSPESHRKVSVSSGCADASEKRWRPQDPVCLTGVRTIRN